MSKENSLFLEMVSEVFKSPIVNTLDAIEGVLSGSFGVIENQDIIDNLNIVMGSQHNLLKILDQFQKFKDENLSEDEIFRNLEKIRSGSGSEEGSGKLETTPSASSDSRPSGSEQEDFDSWNEEASASRKDKKGSVLYASNSGFMGRYVRNLLSEKISVFLASSAEDAFEKTIQFQPDIIISENNMPGKSGVQFLDLLKDSMATKDIPVILFTSSTDTKANVSMLLKGADDYLRKPFSEIELKIRVNNLLNIRSREKKDKDELIAARSIQRALLPKFDAIEGRSDIGFDVFYRPCDLLSGDFYDVFDAGGIIYFYVADVTSHGTASAQVTYLIKSLFNEIVRGSKEEVGAAEVLTALFRKYIDLKLEYAVAIQLGAYHVAEKKIEIVATGSPPMIIKNEEGMDLLAASPGPYMHAGMHDKEPEEGVLFKPLSVSFEGNTQLFLFSDGCYEFSDPNGQSFGLKKLIKVFKESPDENWQDYFYERLMWVNGSANFDDDMTALRIISKG